jgi:Fe-S cluster biogenesis protein NfuA
MTATATPATAAAPVSADDSAMVAQIETILLKLRPIVQSEGGDIRMVSLSEGVLQLELAGGCEGCGGGVATLLPGMRLMLLERVTGLKDVLIA